LPAAQTAQENTVDYSTLQALRNHRFCHLRISLQYLRLLDVQDLTWKMGMTSKSVCSFRSDGTQKNEKLGTEYESKSKSANPE
jgi:hypothetical protein